MKLSQVARGAAEEIRTRGGCFGELVNDRGQVCVTGAIYVAAGARLVYEDGVGKMKLPYFSIDPINNLHNEILTRKPIASIPDWNDTLGRTDQERIALLEEVAEELESEGL